MRHLVLLTAALSCILLAWSVCALALDPSFDISQYAHTAWTVREGFAKGEIISIAQTPDGYLWLGTQFGLLRFDGVRNVPWKPPANQQLPSSYILSLLTGHDGTLWIGTWNGLASWKDGKLMQYPELAGHFIFALLEDHAGTVWASGFSSAPQGGRLCTIRNGNVQCHGEDGSLGRGAENLYEDTKGNLWVGLENGLLRWKPGTAKFYTLAGNQDGIQALGEDADGTLLVGWKAGIYRFVDGKTEEYSLPGFVRQFRADRIFRDHDGGLWIGTLSQGLLHVHNGRTDEFRQSDGLSGDDVHAFFEDREGSIWITTINGLDRFREFAVATLTPNQGLSNAHVGSVLADRDGSVWLATRGGLDRSNKGQIKNDHVLGSNMNDYPNSLFQDDRGRIWVSTARGIGYLENSSFIPASGVPGGNILSIAQDTAGNLWVVNESSGLFRVSLKGEVQQNPWSKLGSQDHASVLAADPAQGGLWIGFFLGGIAYFKDGQIRASYRTADGLGEGRVSDFLFDHEGTLWISTAGGLTQLKNGHLATLTSKNGLPCDTVHWVMEDDTHSFWLYMACGLVRIDGSELSAWSGNPTRTMQVTILDGSDGVRSLATGGHYNPQVAESPDGKLWFLPWDGVSIFDPRHLPFNKLPPPVHIEQITADGKTYDASNGLSLPARVRDLTVNYTALSLVAPEKIHFRYKLEGQDSDWREVVNDRRAEYGNLAPRHYIFRVMACNNSGVWNEAGATLDFVIPPAWYQTNWFRVLCVFGFLGLLWGIHQRRVRELRREFNIGLEARVNERTRIARELHDTLLQNFQGLLPRLQAALYMLPERVAEARKTLETAIDTASEAITEARNAIKAMRLSTVEKNDLAVAVRTLGEELAAVNQPSPTFEVAVEGTPRSLHPILRDEVYRLVAEALRNAFCHAEARKIEVEIRYSEKDFRLQVRDNGRGIDPSILSGDGREGHYGLHGMHERAKIAGGKLNIWSELDSGTEIELSIPALRAYTQPLRSLRLLQKLSGKDKQRQEKV